MNRPIILVCLLSILTGSAFSQSRVSIGINGGVQTALHAFDGGRSVGALVLYEVSDHIQLSVSSGNLWWDGAVQGRFSALPILGGVRLHAATSEIVPYGMLEVGLFSVRTTESFMMPVPLAGTIGSGDTLGFPIGRLDVHPFPFGSWRRSSTTFGYGIGFGVMFSMSEKLDLDVGAKMQYLHDTRSLSDHMTVLVPTTYGSTHEYFTSVSVGLLLRL